ncbi:hypothetical protein FOXYSP1_08120 [Fusarium oxysporum f. sp. phaseoli]
MLATTPYRIRWLIILWHSELRNRNAKQSAEYLSEKLAPVMFSQLPHISSDTSRKALEQDIWCVHSGERRPVRPTPKPMPP